ncbi:MAG: Hsp33 family molecular chaperone HslO [Alphaproteobacteria bacterium]|nr:Hsp33 family molecular chaperone HslO [Alphaproteobacteria bacterium]MBV9693574.1 Hsp33 family molecular chaperone HslO [Alphaproteobacteria bacterium]
MSAQGHIPAPPGDFVLPFDLPAAGVRGRLVRLDSASARALLAHRLPEAASRVMAETLVLGVLLGTSLKLEGRLSVQTKSGGPLDLMVTDYYSAQDDRAKGVRGFARLDRTRAEALAANPGFAALTGEGSLAITIEPRSGAQAYQGIVALSPDGIAASAETYFAQSEQLPTAIRLAAAPLFEAGKAEPQWRAGGIMLQVTPGAQQVDDDWQRLSLILKTVEDLELVDTALAAETLLWRLFHEDEVRVHPAEPVGFRCDCHTDRIASVLRSYSDEDRTGLADADGIIRARCEFCGRVHEVTV